MSTTAIAGRNYCPHQFAASHGSARRRETRQHRSPALANAVPRLRMLRRLSRSHIVSSNRQLTQSDVEISRVPRLSQGSLTSPRSMIPPRQIIANCSLLIVTNSLRKPSALKRRRAGSCGTSSLALLLSLRRQSRSRSSSFDILRSSIMVALSALRRRQFLPPLTETALRT